MTMGSPEEASLSDSDIEGTVKEPIAAGKTKVMGDDKWWLTAGIED